MVEEKMKFEVKTRLGFRVSCSEDYWDYIIKIKHPQMKGKRKEVIKTLKDPEQVRQSKHDRNVYLFYREIIYDGNPKHISVVVNKKEGFIITTYITDRIKEGEQIWEK